MKDDKGNNVSGRDESLHDASTDEHLEDMNADVAPRLGEKRKHPGKRYHSYKKLLIFSPRLPCLSMRVFLVFLLTQNIV